MGRLNHGRIKALDSPGLHGDGDTLYLRVAPGGSKSWIQRVAVNGWRRDIGLGGWPVVPLARARQRAFTNRVAISEGRDPLAEKRKASMPTFREAAIKTFEANRPRWRNVKTAKNWTQQLARHAFAIVGDTPVDRIGREEVGKALATVEASRASLCVKACLWFVVLTACRSGETRGAKWSEIAIEAREWRIPASRMKTNAEHRVSLSDAALAVLEQVLPLRDSSDLVFPSVRGRELSNMTLTKCLRTAGIDAVPHGFRTSFRTWTSEQTSVPHAVAEMALAHAVGSAVERSYARAEPSLSGSGRGAVSVLSPQAAARV